MAHSGIQKFLFVCETAPLGDTAILEGEAYNYFGEFVNMMLTLGAVIVMILVSLWVLKRFMHARAQQVNREASIRILEKRMLGPKSSLYLVDILGKGVVLAESASGLTLIKEFPYDVDIEALCETHRTESERPSFTEQMAQKLKQMAARRA